MVCVVEQLCFEVADIFAVSVFCGNVVMGLTSYVWGGRSSHGLAALQEVTCVWLTGDWKLPLRTVDVTVLLCSQGSVDGTGMWQHS